MADRQALVPGSRVSFVYELRETGGKALEVIVEELAAIRERERGVVVVGFFFEFFFDGLELSGETDGVWVDRSGNMRRDLGLSKG